MSFRIVVFTIEFSWSLIRCKDDRQYVLGKGLDLWPI
jgi:hypothetical protein